MDFGLKTMFQDPYVDYPKGMKLGQMTNPIIDILKQ